MRRVTTCLACALAILLLVSTSNVSTAAPQLKEQEIEKPTKPTKSEKPAKPTKPAKAAEPAKKDPASRLLGTWRCEMPTGTSILVFETPTRLDFDGYAAKYTVVQDVIRVTDEDGTQDYPYTLEGSVLTVGFPEGYEMEFTRVSDKTQYAGETDAGQTDPESGVYDESGEDTGGRVPSQGEEAIAPDEGGDAGLMRHFAGTWWNATTHTETNVTLTADGRYFESYSASYSGSSRDQYGNADMSWGAAGDREAQGTWTVNGTREAGVLTIFFQNGNQRRINYRVHVENGQVYWSEYFFNGELYGKK